ncbi:MAG: hypothetical protein IKO53_00860 [Lachnospiraceae bacterium]|nr:hypothetical protein [Lachnospiraceae bacterium]
MAAVNALKNTTSKLSSPEAYMVATLYSARNKTLSRTVQQNNRSLGNFDKTVPEREERTDYDALVAMPVLLPIHNLFTFLKDAIFFGFEPKKCKYRKI